MLGYFYRKLGSFLLQSTSPLPHLSRSQSLLPLSHLAAPGLQLRRLRDHRGVALQRLQEKPDSVVFEKSETLLSLDPFRKRNIFLSD